jgi:mannose-6-phosphate isomerase-like protein (cupin superfamily)
MVGDVDMTFKKLLAAAVFVLASSSAGAQGTAPFKLSAADLDRMVATPGDGSAKGTVPVGEKGPLVLVLRRIKDGEAEVHDHLNDLFVVRSGRATVLIGGAVAGNRQTAPGEWRGGTIIGADRFEIGPGDVLWIPAGLPHQVLVPRGGDFRYLAFKSAV